MLNKKRSVNSLSEKLLKDSYLLIEPLYSEETINAINSKFDSLFLQQSDARRYVDALDIYNLGLLDVIFTPKLISLIFSIIPNAVLYHCHSYEINGLNTRPHISADNLLDGWHRDIDCIHDLSNNNTIQHVSLFVYLTPVGEGDGAFEICDKKFGYFPRLFKNSNFYRILGGKGHSFLFNRTAFHRASPNRNTTQRRVLKLSFQSKNTKMPVPDEKIKSYDKFFNLLKVKDKIAKNNLPLRHLFGDKGVNEVSVEKFLQEKSYNNEVKILDDKELCKIDCEMNLKAEFKGIARDLIFIKNSIHSKIANKKG
uniref:Fe2OG dioxygenase domain-containing protein n=1 Tax=Rheinheimera sp. BAL341 TaxID=1708203 RepID=A0A486XYP1_9GAMM